MRPFSNDAASETLNRAEAESGIAGTRFAGQLHHIRVVDSTMNLAGAAGAAGAVAGIWVADEQTAGRGRGGHRWHSVAGDGLYVSFLATPHLQLSQGRLIPLATGLAVRAAVAEVTGLTLDLRWPNDLMFDEAKCGGILVESAGKAIAPGHRQDSLRFVVIGIGLNLNHTAFPAGLSRQATSLYLESSRRVDREPILAAIGRRLDDELHLLEQGSASALLLDRFRSASTWAYGRRVRVGADDALAESYTGWTRGLTPDGFLQVEDDAGALRTVLSGGVRSA